MTDKLLLTVKETAAVLGVSPNTVRNLIWLGKLPAFKVQNCVRIKRDDLEQFVANLPRVGVS